MEFKIITDLSVLPQVIETNSEELKAWLTEKVKSYNALVVTPDTIKAAKDDKAALNKLRTALEERRKEVKKQCMAPYEDFERKYKELIALIDTPIASIDTQIKALDEQEQQEKYNRVKEYFGCCMASSMDVPIDVDFDRILNPKWRNKTMKADALEKEIYDNLCRIKADVQELNSYYANSPHYTAIMNTYQQGYDKACALAYAAALIQQEQRKQAQKAAQQPVREPEPTPPPAYEPTPEPPVQEPVQPQNEPRITGVFRVTGTRQQIIALRDFMRANHIEFQIVKEK
jgi:hypothetical protein